MGFTFAILNPKTKFELENRTPKNHLCICISNVSQEVEAPAQKVMLSLGSVICRVVRPQNIL